MNLTIAGEQAFIQDLWRRGRVATPGSVAHCASYIIGSSSCYTEEQILIMANRWADKIARGETSCAWHELAEFKGVECYCAPCRRAAGKKPVTL